MVNSGIPRVDVWFTSWGKSVAKNTLIMVTSEIPRVDIGIPRPIEDDTVSVWALGF